MVGACAESNTAAPATQEASIYVPANFLKIGEGTVFTVRNSQEILQKIGSHAIYIPAGAICDPVTSGYGSTMWDKTCKPMKGSMTITANVFYGPGGEPYIDFQPALRFAPDKQVYVFFREGRTNGLWQASVEYCNNLGYCVDESIADPSLKPFRIDNTSIIGRRVKHFSGYVVMYNDACLGNPEPTGDGGFYCNEEGASTSSMMRRSGYMVASGEDIASFMKDESSDSSVGTTGKQ
jgi:hypothetical protein